MKSKNKFSSGLTLMEMILYLALAGTFLVFALSIFNNFYKSRQLNHRMNTLQNDSNYIFNQLTQEIHWSDKIDLNQLPNEINLTQNQPDDSELTIRFYLSDDRLWKNDEPLSHPRVKIHTFRVINRTPDKDKVPCLEIELGLEYDGATPKVSLENKSTISFRKSKFIPTEK